MARYIELEDLGIITAITFGEDTPENYVIDVVQGKKCLYTVDRRVKVLSEGTLHQGHGSFTLVVRDRFDLSNVLHKQDVTV